FAEQAPFGPVQLDDEIEERLLDRILGGDTDVVVAARGLHHLEAEEGEDIAAFDAGAAELLFVREVDPEGVDLFRSRSEQLDASFERLVEGRFALDGAQPEGQ